jgi:Ca2+:H+ antiporter
VPRARGLTGADRRCAAQLVGCNVEWLVENLDGIEETISREWLGLILLPAISAVAGEPLVVARRGGTLKRAPAECITAINVSVKDRLTLSMSVAIGSSIVRRGSSRQGRGR